MAAEYFPCLFRLGGTDRYVIWYSDDRDGVVREAEGGRIVTFSSVATLQEYARSNGLAIQAGDVTSYDWDSVARWCDETLASEIAVGPFLNAWNMVLDVLPPGGGAGLF